MLGYVSSIATTPLALRGSCTVRKRLASTLDVFSRDMTHQLEREITPKDCVAFNVACQYPDGVRALAAESMELREGKIAEQVEVVAWGE